MQDEQFKAHLRVWIIRKKIKHVHLNEIQSALRSVSEGLCYGLDNREIGLRFLVEARYFSTLQSVHPAAVIILPPM